MDYTTYSSQARFAKVLLSAACAFLMTQIAASAKSASIEGNVGVAGFGSVPLSGHSEIDGSQSFHTGGTPTQSGHAQILSKTFHNTETDAILGHGVIDATPEKATAALSTLLGYPYTSHANKSMTLEGTAATAFINAGNKFSLGDRSSVTLAGGLTWDKGPFNVLGGGAAWLRGSSPLYRNIPAPYRTAELSEYLKVLWEIIAHKVARCGGCSPQCPPIVSP